MAARYAIYFAPPVGGALERFGEGWFGRDGQGRPVERLTIAGLGDADLRRLTETPRVYGFHATLKAPFRLRAGRCLDDLEAALAAFAAVRPVVRAPPLRLDSLGRFLALTLSASCPELDELAGACVRSFDGFRAAPTPEETDRRRAAGLTGRQAHLLERWGYPYVLDAFRFHLTLTGPIADPSGRDHLQSLLAPVLEPLGVVPLVVGEVCLVRQGAPDGPFIILNRFPFGGGPS